MSKFSEALASHEKLLKDAEQLERWAHPDMAAGPSFWRDVRKQTAAAITCDFSEARDDCSWSMSHAMLSAIWDVSSPHVVAMWRDAAKRVRERAAEMLADLEKERAELDAAIAGLKEAK